MRSQAGVDRRRVLLLQAPGFHPTRRHMWEQIQWLVQGAQPGDSLFFSFSGASGCHEPS